MFGNATLKQMMLVPLVGVALVGCADQDVGFSTQSQAIYHGSRAPQVVNLTQSEQLAIGFLGEPTGEPFCTGTLIDRNVVVTAQHCTEGATADQIRFGVGAPEQPTGFFEVSRIAEHPTLDAALLFLAQDAVSAVPELKPLPALRDALPQGMIGSNVEASGYGATQDGSTGRYFASLTLIGIDEDNYVVDGKGQQGICFGDSGGPLLVSLDNRTIVAGVESWGDESCVDVDNLTRLDLISNWMDDQMGNNPGGTATEPNTPSTKPPVSEPTTNPSGDKPESDQAGSPTTGTPTTDNPTTGSPTGGDSGDQTSNDGGGFDGTTLGCQQAGGAQSGMLFAVLLPLLWLTLRPRTREMASVLSR